MKVDFIPFHKPLITDEEISEVVETIRSGWWTTGPKSMQFEQEFNAFIGSKFSLAVNSWTSAAHLALEAIGLKEGDEVIVPSITFTATAEIVCYFKAKPVIVDVQRDSFNIDPAAVEKAVTSKTRAIIPVHYGGNPCDMFDLLEIAKRHNLKIIEDAAHALPASYRGKNIGTIGDVTCFSFYVTKTLSTGEGGMLCTNNGEIAERCAVMRLHGINKDAWKRYAAEGSWYYEVIAPGFKYNLSDIHASLGLAQLKKQEAMRDARKQIFEKYNFLFSNLEEIELYHYKDDREPSYHLYPVLLDIDRLSISRAEFIEQLKKLGIGTSVHFIPLYRHPYYKENFNLSADDYPVSEYIYPRLVSLPIWPGMTDEQIDRVTGGVISIIQKFKR